MKKKSIRTILVLSIIIAMVFPYNLISFAVNETEENNNEITEENTSANEEKTTKNLKSNYYKIDNNNKIISVVEPETDISLFKTRVYFDDDTQDDEYKIYKDNNKKQEMTSGIIKTGMVLSFKNIDYYISVVGDINHDGKITQIDISYIIRHITSLNENKLSGVDEVSADVTLDGKVDQRDLTKAIRYLVKGNIDLGKIDITGPEVKIETKEITQTSIKVQASAIDREEGMDERPVYKFDVTSIDGQKITTYEGTDTNLLIENLKPYTEYIINVETQDKCGNVGKKETTIRTLEENIPNAENAITFENIVWNNEKASIELKNNSDYYIEYQIINESENKTEEEIENGNWIRSEIKESVQLNELNYNDIIYVRLTNGRVSGKFTYRKIVEDTIVPTVTLTQGLTTTNSISVMASAVDNESGMPNTPTYTFYLKEGNGSYTQKQSGNSSNYTATGLKANTEYTIKVETQDSAGNTGSKEISITTNAMPTNTEIEQGTITFSNVTWANQKASVTISTNTTYTIQYQVNNYNGTWTTGTVVDNLVHGDKVYARLTDGVNKTDYATLRILDTEAPEVTLTQKGVTTNTIEVEAVATDNAKIAESPMYTFYIKEGTGEYIQQQRNASNKYIATGLKANTEYTIKAETEDVVGNVGSKEITIKTNAMPTETELEQGAITFSNIVWTNEKASLTIATNTKYTIQYQIGDITGAWTNGGASGANVTVSGLQHGDKVYARLTDGVNYTDYKLETVKDTINPEVTLTKGEVTTNSIEVRTGATDNAGMPNTPTYTFYLKESSGNYTQKQSGNSTNYTATGLKANTEYTIKVETQDSAGNIGSKEISITTNAMPEIMTETGAIVFRDCKWTNGKAEITITTNTNYTIEYQINSTSESWTRANSAGTNVLVQNLNNNDKIYARLTDGENATDYAMSTILDKIVPTVTLTQGPTTTNSISVTASAVDNESGMPSTPTYTFYLKESSGSYTQKQSGNSANYTATGLKANTTYTIKVETQDSAGNIGRKEITLTTTSMPDITIVTGAITFGNAKWTSNGKASVEISTSTTLFIEYQINSYSGNWTRSSSAGNDITVTNLNNNDKIYARLTDGTNVTDYATLTIADTTLPDGDISIEKASVKPTEKIVAKITATDTDSGINITDCKWIINNSNSEIGTQESLYTAGNVESDGSINTTASTTEGTYYMHILLKDRVGNKKELISEAIKVSSIQYNYTATNMVEYDAGNWTQSDINSLISLGLYNMNISKDVSEETGLDFTFGGFTYNGDTSNQNNINTGKVITNRNKSVNEDTSDGWVVLEWGNTVGNKRYVKKLIHAGIPERFVFTTKDANSTGDAYRAEYILSSGKRQVTYNTYNARDFSMYIDKNKTNMIKSVYCINDDSATNINDNFWIAEAYSNNTLRYEKTTGTGSTPPYYSDYGNYGIRPVIELNDGVYVDISEHTGSGTDQYVLKME